MKRTDASRHTEGDTLDAPFIERAGLPETREVWGADSKTILDYLAGVTQPLILRGYCAHFPSVAAAKKSDRAMADYLLEHYSGYPVNSCYGEAKTGGRVFYNEDMSGFNFQVRQTPLGTLLDEILCHAGQSDAPMRYMPSSEVSYWFPHFSAANEAGVHTVSPVGSLWLGNKVRIAAHYDFPNNLACNIAGQRRFTLLPPDQINNLYPGPLEFAPGGQEISLVDFHNPDFEKFPRFRSALDHAQVAVLEAGDALYIPGMWWHHVESMGQLNVLYTHWWRDSAAYMGRPTNALLHAVLGLRNLPAHQRKAWKALFDYYIFDAEKGAAEHIAPGARGMLEQPLALDAAMQLRAKLQNDLKR
ncbi:cupin-like domain-containing protein [uncultured Microbulbifer sp.]|uniref:cupin-like domain-containing protein n=1 Tax=uncultured Microbulbifer sp. TaxID=348147 RepID=UPI00261A434C|nr:cupin-like domain-containing protein [uncultured Microbulbifer sp.]